MRPIHWILLVAAVALAGGGYWFLHTKGVAAASAAATASSAAADRPVPVVATAVVKKDMPIYLTGLGSVVAFNTVLVRTQVDGRIDKIGFVEGQDVKKGDLLAQIDPRPFQIQLENAQAALARDAANLKNARVNLDRYDILVKQQLIPVQQQTDQKAQVDQLVATLGTDQAAIDTARLNLAYAHITSPLEGKTGIRQVDAGNLVHAADATGIVYVTQLDPIAVLFTLPEDDLPQISAEMANRTLTVEALSRDGTTSLGLGKVALVDNQIIQATGTIKLKAVFDNPKKALWPNQFVKARLLLTTRKDSLVMPAAVIQRGPNGTFAYVIGDDQKVTARPVTLATIDGDVAIVATGLAAGEQVVVDGQYQLAPGKRVTSRPPDKPGDKPAGSADKPVDPPAGKPGSGKSGDAAAAKPAGATRPAASSTPAGASP